MKQFFIDTNILIDFIADRKPFGENAARLFQLADENKIKLHIAALSFSNTHYVLKKYISEETIRKIFLELFELLEIIPHTKQMLKVAAKSQHKDFEDAFQIVAAESNNNITVIVTRNLKDFKKASLSVLLPEQALELID
ncbi:MAG TPA: PIN domain-containing protein [Puia sp.]|jgi:predicted nucleic acid-binding protein|nr:PIN domain-containing protein [Puia sp.]